MEQPWRSVPGSADVPFHVGVITEQIAIGGEGNVVDISHPAGNQIPSLAVGVSSPHRSGRHGDAMRMATRVRNAWQQSVFGKVLKGRIGG